MLPFFTQDGQISGFPSAILPSGGVFLLEVADMMVPFRKALIDLYEDKSKTAPSNYRTSRNGNK